MSVSMCCFYLVLVLCLWATQVASLRYRAATLPRSEKWRVGSMLFMSSSPESEKSVEVCSFSMGCFWAPQKTFSNIDGVLETMVGYTGGPNTTPTYASVCSGDGHIETVRLVFDPKLVTYEQLLDVFMQDEQPTLAGQYQSVLWPRSESQRAAAESRLGSLAQGDQRALVSMRPAETFFPAEEYHDKYLAKQGPRNLLLAVSLLGTLWPQLPLSASDAQTMAALVPGWLTKAPAACSIAYLAIFILERALDRGKEPIV